MSTSQKIKVALLDMNNNTPNRGISYLKKMLSNYNQIEFSQFDVRHKNEIPDLSFDIYISSGGPGSPFDMEGGWDKSYFSLIDQIDNYNTQKKGNYKYIFFICHSFQLACIHYKIAELMEREKMSFGVYPAYKTYDGEYEKLFEGLDNPFWIADFRFWQVVNPNRILIDEKGYQILAYERLNNNHTKFKAIMAVRFSPFVFGTQFHPEADAEGMIEYFNTTEKKEQIISDFGSEAYFEMMTHLEDDEKINKTFNTILPNFLNDTIRQLSKDKTLV
jgi:homoserine O-succinyltransferase/O-acetyltransferase